MDTRPARMMLVATLLAAISGCDAAAQPAPQVIYATPAPAVSTAEESPGTPAAPAEPDSLRDA